MRFVDANVIIQAFTENNDQERCRKILSGDFVTNTLCLVEAHHSITLIRKDSVYAAGVIKSLYRGGGTIISLDRNLIFESCKRLEKYDLSLFDLIHFVTALLGNCEVMVSYDKHFDGLDIKRIEP